MSRKSELFALAILLLLLLAFPASLFAYQAWTTNPPGARVISITASGPGSGGWQPDTIRVNVGERVRLRISSTDVVHGFAVPALGLNVDEILPGHVQEIEFTANHAGRFPFACTRWCSLDHWRMRGVVEVIDPARPDAPLTTPAAPPLYQQMKIDIDALHPAAHVPAAPLSAARGAHLGPLIPAHMADREYLRAHSPSDLWAELRAEPSLAGDSDVALWDALVWSMRQSAGDAALARGRALYSRDCAACHGETGKGDGPAGIKLPGRAALHPDAGQSHSGQAMKRGPADFSDASQMLGASDVLLQGKILRGGMGSGMPEWGSLYTPEEMWDVIAFVRGFAFDIR